MSMYNKRDKIYVWKIYLFIYIIKIIWTKSTSSLFKSNNTAIKFFASAFAMEYHISFISLPHTEYIIMLIVMFIVDIVFPSYKFIYDMTRLWMHLTKTRTALKAQIRQYFYLMNRNVQNSMLAATAKLFYLNVRLAYISMRNSR